MGTFFVVFVTFSLVILAMSVGVIFKRKPISGSCGGLNNVYQSDDGDCQICGAKVDENCKNKVENY
ncbi:MAG: (Na+)-NQR maturation NqrM [Oligoflexales bacterium]